MENMKLKTLLRTAVALIAACALAQERQPIKALKTDDLGTMDVSEFLVWRWGFQIDKPDLHRLDLRFFVGTNELMHTWQFVENTNAQQRFEIAIDFLKDTDANQWRLYSAFRGQSSCWKRTVPIPEQVKGLKCSMGGGPILQADGKYHLVKFYSKPPAEFVEIPLSVSVTLTEKDNTLPNQGIQPTK